MRSRTKMTRKRSKKLFRKSANRIHKRNVGGVRPIRGGFRI